VPGLVAGLRNVVEVAIGDTHAFAVQTDGSVWSWGNNANGQLGDGTKTSRSTPQQVLCPSGYAGFLNLNADSCAAKPTNTLQITNYPNNPVTSSLIVTVNGVPTDLVASGNYQGAFPSDSTVTLDIVTPLNYTGFGWSGDLDTTNTYAVRIVVPMNRDWDLSPRVGACRYTHVNYRSKQRQRSGACIVRPHLAPGCLYPCASAGVCKLPVGGGGFRAMVARHAEDWPRCCQCNTFRRDIHCRSESSNDQSNGHDSGWRRDERCDLYVYASGCSRKYSR